MANRNALCVNCLPLLPKKVDRRGCVYITKGGEKWNIYMKICNIVFYARHVGTLPLKIGGIQTLLIWEAILCTDGSKAWNFD